MKSNGRSILGGALLSRIGGSEHSTKCNHVLMARRDMMRKQKAGIPLGGGEDAA
jgi:hypothetical protein